MATKTKKEETKEVEIMEPEKGQRLQKRPVKTLKGE